MTSPLPALGRLQWKVKNHAIHIIIARGGMIFGGAARDKYLHDAHSTKFFEANPTFVDSEGLSHQEDVNTLYQDPEYMPELRGRFAVPRDIDAFVHVSKRDSVITALGRLFPKITKLFVHDVKRYFPDTIIPENTVQHEKYLLYPVVIPDAIIRWLSNDEMSVEQKMKLNALKVPVVLDLLVYLNDPNTMIDPPFGSLDFTCNALCLDKDGYRLSKHMYTDNSYLRTRLLRQVFDDIEERKCKVVTFNSGRIKKMRDRGWSIENLFKGITEMAGMYSGHCIICHGDLEQPPEDSSERAPKLHMKLACCDARYHPTCLMNTLNIGEEDLRTNCIMCSQPIVDVDVDAERLQGYLEQRIHIM